MTVSSNKAFGRWGEVFGDDTVAAMIDRLVHHAEVINLKGDSYRLKGRDLGRVPGEDYTSATVGHRGGGASGRMTTQRGRWPQAGGQFSPGVDNRKPSSDGTRKSQVVSRTQRLHRWVRGRSIKPEG